MKASLYECIGVGCLLLTASLNALAEPYLPNKEGNLILDKATNLVWMRCSLGQIWDSGSETCKGSANEYTFESALKAAEGFNREGGISGYTDWRVPTARELASIRHCSNGFRDRMNDDVVIGIPHACAGNSYQHPTINPKIFPQTVDSWYWSSTYSSDPRLSEYAWYVNFKYGLVTIIKGYRFIPGAVRLVRFSK